MATKLGGVFTISLDFEMHWGVIPSFTVEQYYDNLEGTPLAIEHTLSLFRQYDIHATWATVGFLFSKDKEELLGLLPSLQPTYEDKNMDSYRFLRKLSTDYPPHFHFAPDLIEKIKATPHQEIGTHSFSHYFCLEKGQTPDQFRADLQAAVSIAEKIGINLQSIVFPRDQYNVAYLKICKELGITFIRASPSHYIYKPRARKVEKRLFFRAMRLLDTYFNLTGHHLVEATTNRGIIDIPASRKFRPYIKRLSSLEPFKLQRIKKEMTLAAQQDKIYHLWWHPHNLGANSKQNLEQIQAIFEHYKLLKKQYNFRSLNMQEIGNLYIKATRKHPVSSLTYQ